MFRQMTSAFRYAICAQRDWWPFVLEPEGAKPGLAFDMRPSDKGRYLTAVLRMAGIFIEQKKSSYRSSGKNGLSDSVRHPRQPTNALQRLFNACASDLRAAKYRRRTNGRAWPAWCSRKRARNASLSRFLKFDDLITEFETYREAYWARYPAAAPHDAQRIMASVLSPKSVKYLCQREILHQGHEWRCHQCFYNNWLSIDDLKRSMVCEVCGNSEPAPVADSWHFRLNQFILEGFREHGLLPSIWCLAKHAELARTSFFYLDSHELFFTGKASRRATRTPSLIF